MIIKIWSAFFLLHKEEDRFGDLYKKKTPIDSCLAWQLCLQKFSEEELRLAKFIGKENNHFPIFEIGSNKESKTLLEWSQERGKKLFE